MNAEGGGRLWWYRAPCMSSNKQRSVFGSVIIPRGSSGVPVSACEEVARLQRYRLVRFKAAVLRAREGAAGCAITARLRGEALAGWLLCVEDMVA